MPGFLSSLSVSPEEWLDTTWHSLSDLWTGTSASSLWTGTSASSLWTGTSASSWRTQTFQSRESTSSKTPTASSGTCFYIANNLTKKAVRTGSSVGIDDRVDEDPEGADDETDLWTKENAATEPKDYDRDTFPWFERPHTVLPASRGTYHGVNGNVLKVLHPGHTDLVWATNFNDEYVDHLVCPLVSSKTMSGGLLGSGLGLEKWSTRGIHPEFIFSKAIGQVTINIYESTKFSQMEQGFEDQYTRNGERQVSENGINNIGGWAYTKRHRKLWKATFNLAGGNHILANAMAPPFRRFCDAPNYNVWDGQNIGKWNNRHQEPSLYSFFDVHIDGYTAQGKPFHDDMKVMLDRRPAFQAIYDFKRAHDYAKTVRAENDQEGPALWAAQMRNYWLRDDGGLGPVEE